MDVDLLDGELYLDPGATYAWLRDEAPLYWDAANELWAVSRHADVVEVETRKQHFTSADQTKGGYRPNIPADRSLIGLDDPAHHDRRGLVARRFTPRAVAAWEPEVRATVTRLLDAVEGRGGDAEIVGDLAAPLPAMVIGRLLGFDDEQWPDLQAWSERTIMLGGGPRYMNEDGVMAAMEFAQASADLYTAKQRCPVDDVMSTWAATLDVDTAISDSLLLLDGGAETTRTVIARTFLALTERPDQWELLRAGADPVVAVEELIRWVTPIHNMCRVAVGDQEVAGGVVPDGHQVVLLYGAANRDPRCFDDPDRLDLTRHPNHHVAFGFGTHFCLGAALARLEIRVFLEELVRRVRAFRPAGAPVEMPNAFVYGLRAAPYHLDFA